MNHLLINIYKLFFYHIIFFNIILKIYKKFIIINWRWIINLIINLKIKFQK